MSSELSALTEDTAPAATDIVYKVDSGGTTDRKVSFSNIFSTFQNTHTAAVKSADQTVNNTATKVAVTDVLVAVSANTTYSFLLSVYHSSDAAADTDLAWTVPSGTTMSWERADLSTGALSESAARDLAGTGVGTVRVSALIGRIVVGGTAGNVQLTFAQNVAQANDCTIHEGTSLIAWEE